MTEKKITIKYSFENQLPVLVFCKGRFGASHFTALYPKKASEKRLIYSGNPC